MQLSWVAAPSESRKMIHRLRVLLGMMLMGPIQAVSVLVRLLTTARLCGRAFKVS